MWQRLFRPGSAAPLMRNEPDLEKNSPKNERKERKRKNRIESGILFQSLLHAFFLFFQVFGRDFWPVVVRKNFSGNRSLRRRSPFFIGINEVGNKDERIKRDDEEAASKLLDLGFFLSFTGILTFKNAGPTLEVAKKIPLDRFMLETDSPYLAPQAHRGKRNEPAYLADLAVFLSAARGISAEELAERTTENAKKFFKLA